MKQMEFLSKEITKYIQEESLSFNPITIKNINQIKTISEIMNKNSSVPKFSIYLDKEGNICNDERTFDGHRSNIFIRKINSPYRIDFNWKEGFFSDENTFCPQIYLDSEIDDEMDVRVNFLKTKFISAVSEIIETPKIVLSEPFKRMNLNEFFQDTNDVLICFQSEINPIISRLSATR